MPKTKQKPILVVATMLINLTFKTILPFIIGFYYGLTTSLIFLLIFVLLLLIDVRIEYHKDTIKLKIVRGL